MAWPWLKAKGKPELSLRKPLNLALAEGQGQAMIHFLKFTRLTKLTKFGWPCLAKASAEPANFSESSKLNKFVWLGCGLRPSSSQSRLY